MSVPIDHRAGSQLGSFLLGDVLGRGGMGVVYRATNLDTSDEVALKLMSPELSTSEEFRQRFLNEAAVGPIMDHPNVVPIYGSGEVDGELYIAMKLIEGRNLKEVLKKEGALEPKRALRIFRQVASALDAAHESGMVHRDIKPQNILLATDDGHHDLAYVSDFGLVKPMSSDTSASRTGQVFGSLPYMAPEQIEVMEMDGRADVYALACVLFESLTGKPPFERPNEVAVVWAHVHEQPPFVTEVNKDLPGGIDGVVMQAMSKHPDDRFLTCGEFIEAFEQGLGRQHSRVSRAMRPLVARTERPKTEREVWGPNFFPELSRIRKVQRKINWWKVGAFATACFLIASVQVGREGGLTQAVSDVAAAAGSAGRSLIDAVGSDEDATSTRRREPRDAEIAAESGPLSGFVGLQLPLGASGTEPDESLRSPTLRSITPPDSVLSESLMIFTSNRRYPASERDPRYGSMDLFAMNADGSRLRNLSASNDSKSDLFPELSPCGQLAFMRAVGDYDHLYVLAADGAIILLESWLLHHEIALSPDCRRFVYRVGESLIIRNLYNSEERVVIRHPGHPRYPEWSPDGSKILFDAAPAGSSEVTGGVVSIFVVNADGTGLTRLTATQSWDVRATWSPDGSKIAFRRGAREVGADGDVWVMNADGSEQQQLTHAPGDDLPLTWSPDGQNIVFFSDRNCCVAIPPDYRGDIYVMDADGTDERDLIPDGGGLEGWAAWQPPVYRTVSAHIEGTVLSGRVTALHASCTTGRDVYIERQEGERWFIADSVTTSSSGRFSYAMPSEGTYRARLFLGRTEGGLLCGSAMSRTRTGV